MTRTDIDDGLLRWLELGMPYVEELQMARSTVLVRANGGRVFE